MINQYQKERKGRLIILPILVIKLRMKEITGEMMIRVIMLMMVLKRSGFRTLLMMRSTLSLNR